MQANVLATRAFNRCVNQFALCAHRKLQRTYLGSDQCKTANTHAEKHVRPRYEFRHDQTGASSVQSWLGQPQHRRALGFGA